MSAVVDDVRSVSVCLRLTVISNQLPSGYGWDLRCSHTHAEYRSD